MSRGVGPGRPPRGSRFRKGESGNPNGRPKKPKQQQAPAFEILFDRTIPVMQNGQQRDLTVDEALQLKTYQDALAGKRPAIREVLKMIEKRDARLAKRTLTFRPLRRFMEYDSNNANEARYCCSASPSAIRDWTTRATNMSVCCCSRGRLKRH